MTFPRYGNYLNCGVEWLGELPSHWRVTPLKAVTSFNDEALPDTTAEDEEIEYLEISGVRADKGIVETSVMPFGHAPSRARRKVRDGDIVISTVRTYLRAVAAISQPPPNFVVSTGFAVIRAQKVVPKFLGYTLRSEPFIAEVIARSVGISYPAINASDLVRIPVTLPPEQEQVAIAAFLDHETQKIDALVEEQKRLIALLKEKRQAVISRAVSKGLNPDAPMKESGVEWLGQVPRTWEVRTIGSISLVVRGASPRPAGDPRFFDGSDVPWVTVAEITKDENKFLFNTEAFLTTEGSRHSRTFKAGTLIYSNSGATLGVPKILGVDACANDGVIGLERLNKAVNIHFLYYFLTSITSAIREKIKQGSGQPNLNTDIVKSIKFALPPLAEQVEIVKTVEAVFSMYRQLEEEAEKAITLLQERSAALISAAITGKIDVRGLAPDQAEAA